MAQKVAQKPIKKLAKKSTQKRSQNTPDRSGEDRGEQIAGMEPLVISEGSKHRADLSELVIELTQSATRFRSSLPEGMVTPLCDLVRSMNCYYSNKIEGHDTHPVDIERALAEDYSADKKRRDRQFEAKAHIVTQRWIDEGNIKGNSTTVHAVRDVHKRFEGVLPDDLLWVENPETGDRVRIVPGEFRENDTRVGRHYPVSPGAIERFMKRWEAAYSKLNKFETILHTAAAHHRLLWIHPFADGNGRVARLISYSTFLDTLDTGGIWSIARGLSRESEQYKQKLAACDLEKRNDLDGRGPLSEEELVKFTIFFLETCLDQIQFMEKLMNPAELRNRIITWAKDEERTGSLPERSTSVLAHILTHRELPRKDVVEVVGLTARKSRRVTAELHKRGVITADTHKAPFRIAFPADLAPRFMPGLYPRLPERPE